MKIINLLDLEKSDIKYKISKFPDGQQNIIINNTPFNLDFLNQPINKAVQIKSRLNNFQDLELIICTVKSLRELGVKEIHLYTPYFLGSRSDRKFEEGSCNYLKDVICPIINSLGFESVTVLDPHSYVLEACLNNFKKVSNYDIVKYTFDELDIINKKGLSKCHPMDAILVSPDAGASHKIYKLAEQIGFKGDIITCSKERDSKGQLTLTNIPFRYDSLGCCLEEESKKDFIIIDDICDGGKTFINIAIEIKERCPKQKIYLIVTHGIFSKGFKELEKYFDGIYTTNSVGILSNNCNLFDAENNNLVRTLNVF